MTSMLLILQCMKIAAKRDCNIDEEELTSLIATTNRLVTDTVHQKNDMSNNIDYLKSIRKQAIETCGVVFNWRAKLVSCAIATRKLSRDRLKSILEDISSIVNDARKQVKDRRHNKSMNKNIAMMKYKKHDTVVTFNRPVVMEAPVKLVNK